MSEKPEDHELSGEDVDLPDGTCCFPYIEDETGINPLLLSLVQLVVFVAGSDKAIVNQEAAGPILDMVSDYMGRLGDLEVNKLKSEMNALIEQCRKDGWEKGHLEILHSFLDDIGAGAG
ncbi:MAG: hypothetical protein EXR99_10515 [Gemmataceae bacterium]|nr:hypothetical protein [Gemmataceae bacterium]